MADIDRGGAFDHLLGTWLCLAPEEQALHVTGLAGAGNADKVFPSVSANGGSVVVSYYTSGYANPNPACFFAIPSGAVGGVFVATTSSVCLDYAAKSSVDGFASERRLASEGSNPYVQFADGSFIGDNTQVAVGSNGMAHASWTDFRGNPGVNGPHQDVHVSSFAAGS